MSSRRRWATGVCLLGRGGAGQGFIREHGREKEGKQGCAVTSGACAGLGKGQHCGRSIRGVLDTGTVLCPLRRPSLLSSPKRYIFGKEQKRRVGNSHS